MDFFLQRPAPERKLCLHCANKTSCGCLSHLSILLALPSCSSYLTQRMKIEWKRRTRQRPTSSRLCRFSSSYYDSTFSFSFLFFSVVNEGKQREIFTHEKSLFGPERTSGLLTDDDDLPKRTPVHRPIVGTHVCVGSRVDFLTIARLLSQSFSTTFRALIKVFRVEVVVVIEEKRRKIFPADDMRESQKYESDWLFFFV